VVLKSNVACTKTVFISNLRSLASEVLATLQFILLMGMGRRGTSSISVHELLILFSFDNKDTFCSLTTTKQRFNLEFRCQKREKI
jgi:hypothetical protein